MSTVIEKKKKEKSPKKIITKRRRKGGSGGECRLMEEDMCICILAFVLQSLKGAVMGAGETTEVSAKI